LLTHLRYRKPVTRFSQNKEILMGVSWKQESSVSYNSFDAAQDMVSFLGCKCTLLAHVELFINWHPQVFFAVLLSICRATVNLFHTQPIYSWSYFNPGTGLCTWRPWTSWGFIGPRPRPAKIHLDGLTTPQQVESLKNSQGVYTVLLSMSLTKMLNNSGPNTDTYRTPTHHWSLPGHQVSDQNSECIHSVNSLSSKNSIHQIYVFPIWR